MNKRTVRWIDIKAAKKICITKTNSIVIGDTYFLSNFYDVEGSFVKVLSKSTKKNACGWPSSVKVQIINTYNIPHHNKEYYAVGKVLSVNATNLYKNREDASPAVKYGKI